MGAKVWYLFWGVAATPWRRVVGSTNPRLSRHIDQCCSMLLNFALSCTKRRAIIVPVWGQNRTSSSSLNEKNYSGLNKTLCVGGAASDRGEDKLEKRTLTMPVRKQGGKILQFLSADKSIDNQLIRGKRNSAVRRTVRRLSIPRENARVVLKWRGSVTWLSFGKCSFQVSTPWHAMHLKTSATRVDLRV